MATRNRAGRNLISSSPYGSKIAYARYLTLNKAKAKGIYNQTHEIITACMSISQLENIERRYQLNDDSNA